MDINIDMSYLKREFPFLSEVDGLDEKQAVPFWLKLLKHLGGFTMLHGKNLIGLSLAANHLNGPSFDAKQGQEGKDHNHSSEVLANKLKSELSSSQSLLLYNICYGQTLTFQDMIFFGKQKHKEGGVLW